jgi:hypothetical protein
MCAKYDALGAAGYGFVPLSVETHSRLGQAFMDFLGKIGEVAEAGSEGAFSKSPFVAIAFHKLSVSLCLLSGLLQATSHMLLAPSTCRVYLCLVLTPWMGDVLWFDAS